MNDEKLDKLPSPIPDSLIQEALESVDAAQRKGGEKQGKKEEAPAAAAPPPEARSDKEQELYERLLRVSADLDNFKKRTARERAELHKFAAEPLLRDLLPVLDNFRRALALEVPPETSLPLIEGIRLIERELEAVLERHGVQRIEALGKLFDPLHHEAIATRSLPAAEEEAVLEVSEEGYLLHGRLLRPSKVVVNQAAGPPAPESEPGTAQENGSAGEAEPE